jgi:hypothetical protein
MQSFIQSIYHLEKPKKKVNTERQKSAIYKLKCEHSTRCSTLRRGISVSQSTLNIDTQGLCNNNDKLVYRQHIFNHVNLLQPQNTLDILNIQHNET